MQRYELGLATNSPMTATVPHARSSGYELEGTIALPSSPVAPSDGEPHVAQAGVHHGPRAQVRAPRGPSGARRGVRCGAAHEWGSRARSRAVRSLKNTDWFSKSDPVCNCAIRNFGDNEPWKPLGHTGARRAVKP